MLKKAVGYTRVSRMLENKLSTESQIQEIERFCEYNNYEIVHIYSDEDLSGSETKHRVQFNQMFEDIEKKTYGKIDIVICYNLSRFSRSIVDMNTCVHKLKEDLKCDFRTVQESFIDTSSSMGNFLLNIFASVAQLERDRLISTISDSNRNRAKFGGRWTNGGIPPYGYIKENKTIVPEPTTSEIVKLIFNMFTEEKIPLSTIAKKLNKDGIDPNRPDQDVSIYRRSPLLDEMKQDICWNGSKIRRILENPVYAGINVTNRRKKCKSKNDSKTSHFNNDPHNWVFSNNLKINRIDEDNFWNSDFEILGYDVEPVISWDQFIKAQKIKDNNSKNEAVREKSNYLLKDLIYCGLCGRKMNGSVNHRDAKRTYYYYRCNKRNYLDLCEMKNVRCEIVDNYVMCALSDSFILMMIADLVDRENEEINKVLEKYSKEIEDKENEIALCENSINNLISLIKSTNTIDIVKDTLTEELNKETQRKQRLDTELKRIKERALLEEQTQADIDGFIDSWRKADFTKMSFDLRRSFFEKYIDKVVYFSPEHIDIYVKINKTSKKLDFTEEQKEKIKYKLNTEKSAKRKIYNVKNKFLEMVKNLENTMFSWAWCFVDEPLRVHVYVATRTNNYIVVKITFFEE